MSITVFLLKPTLRAMRRYDRPSARIPSTRLLAASRYPAAARSIATLQSRRGFLARPLRLSYQAPARTFARPIRKTPPANKIVNTSVVTSALATRLLTLIQFPITSATNTADVAAIIVK
jgi:hypothetical protein